ncbi:MAG: hypothetical protein E3K37_04425 [Candidatus Kuenenia sp.]|nr:hypothetical protein [Candidatus Kuenenia hertensis]
MGIVNKKKVWRISFLLVPAFLLCIGCANTAYKKELAKKDEEINLVRVDVQHKAKTINDLLDRLSWKDQEIGKLTDEIRTASATIETLKKEIEKLQANDLLDRLSQKDQEIGKISDELRASKEAIETLKNNIEKLQKSELLDRLAKKDQVIGKLSTDLHSATSEINTLKKDIGKLSEIDLQTEEKKKEADNLIISVNPADLLPGATINTTNMRKSE